jgi:hypothetical protein
MDDNWQGTWQYCDKATNFDKAPPNEQALVAFPETSDGLVEGVVS